jgi:hypothetical protein
MEDLEYQAQWIVSTQQTDHTERFEIEESAEFLPAVDISSSHIMEDLEYQVQHIILTRQTDHRERFEIEESAEFLPTVDISSSHIMDDLEYQVQHIIHTLQTDHTERFEIEERSECNFSRFCKTIKMLSSYLGLGGSEDKAARSSHQHSLLLQQGSLEAQDQVGITETVPLIG